MFSTEDFSLSGIMAKKIISDSIPEKYYLKGQGFLLFYLFKSYHFKVFQSKMPQSSSLSSLSTRIWEFEECIVIRWQVLEYYNPLSRFKTLLSLCLCIIMKQLKWFNDTIEERTLRQNFIWTAGQNLVELTAAFSRTISQNESIFFMVLLLRCPLPSPEKEGSDEVF